MSNDNATIETPDCDDAHENRRFEVNLKIAFTAHTPKLNVLDQLLAEVTLGMAIEADIDPYLNVMRAATDDFVIETTTSSEVAA